MSQFSGRDFLVTAISLANVADEGAQRSAISRAYYACFLAARVLLWSRGIPVRQDGSAHVTVRTSLELGHPRSRVAWELKRLHSMRKKADYDIPFPDPDLPAEVRSAIDLATGILAEIDRLSSQTSPATQEE